MFRFMSFFLIILFENLNAQIHLNRSNLATVCGCDMQSSYISLSFRNIKTIDPATFTGLTSLRWLYLHYNQISSIDPASFPGLTSLQYLCLDSHQISSIDPATFTFT